MVPTIEWRGNQIRMIDQRKLPAKIQWYTCRGYRDVVSAIEKMVIRGAPAIGVAAAMGLALGAASIRTDTYGEFRRRFLNMAKRIAHARPTAVNLPWAVDRMSALVDSLNDRSVGEIKKILRKESEEILKRDIHINKKIGKIGQALIPQRAIILTHCNAGALATGGYGTALGVIRAAHAAGKKVEVLADETRPWLQGLRLTSFELMEDGIPVQVIVDNAAGSFMRRKMVDMVITGADRIAANGDVANKIGTYQVAVLAKENRVPFYVAAPLYTVDMNISKGDAIPVEERGPEEIIRLGKQRIGPPGVKALNPAFDITPARYVTGIITEKGIIKPPYVTGIKRLFEAARKIQ
jgi:methylthioribose-1-phosphate isomerase